jgi:hypothetical protein
MQHNNNQQSPRNYQSGNQHTGNRRPFHNQPPRYQEGEQRQQRQQRQQPKNAYNGGGYVPASVAPRDLANLDCPEIQLDTSDGDDLPVLTLTNSLSKISFCDKECYNVNNNRTKEQIIKYIQKKYKLNIIEKQYVIINPHMIRNISFHEHLLATFTNGNPYLLYLTRIDGLPCSIYIDRKLKEGYSYPKIHCVQYMLDSALFDQDTLFTGELIRDINRNWQFLISDLLIYEGVDTKNKNVLSRFQLIHNIMDNMYKPDPVNDICPIMVKRLFQYADAKYLIEDFMPNLSYTCKGVVFYTLNSQFSDYAWVIPKENQFQPTDLKRKHEIDQAFYTKYPEYAKHMDIETNQLPHLAEHPSNNPGKRSLESLCAVTQALNPMFKSKYIHVDEPVSLVIMKTEIPDIYYLYTADNHTERIGTAFVLNLEMSQTLNKYFDGGSQTSAISRCYYHKYFDRWIPFELSADKDDDCQPLVKTALTTTEYGLIHARFKAEFSGLATTAGATYGTGAEKYPL